MIEASEAVRFPAHPNRGDVSALLLRPADSKALLVLGHGAGAGMRHPFMEALAKRLAGLQIATFRYQFPYMEAGKRRPDHGSVLQATVGAAVSTARRLAEDLPLFAGGKSMGGRMTSLAAARDGLDAVRGLVFFGFPLHPASNPGTERSEHLRKIELPLLFLQGTRDALADLELLEPVIGRLGARARLHVVEGGDHSFKLLKRSGRTQEDALDELAAITSRWVLDSLE